MPRWRNSENYENGIATINFKPRLTGRHRGKFSQFRPLFTVRKRNSENSENGSATAIFRVFKVSPWPVSRGLNSEHSENVWTATIFRVFRVGSWHSFFTTNWENFGNDVPTAICRAFTVFRVWFWPMGQFWFFLVRRASCRLSVPGFLGALLKLPTL